MAEIKIRDVPDSLVEWIDCRAKREGLSRNQYLLKALEEYAELHDEKLHEMLPKIVESQVRSELKRFEEKVTESFNMILISMLRLNKTNEKLNSFLFPELENLRIDGMDIEQLLAIINSESGLNDDDFIEEIIKNDSEMFGNHNDSAVEF